MYNSGLVYKSIFTGENELFIKLTNITVRPIRSWVHIIKTKYQ